MVAHGNDPDRPVVIGRINGVYGIQGGLKVFSFTRPRERIFSYQPWLLLLDGSWVCRKHHAMQEQGKALVVFLDGISDTEQARVLLGVDIAVPRRELPDLPAGEYYWCDLIHLELIDTHGKSLGRIVDMMETGANDVMVVQGEQRFLVPWVLDTVVRVVDLESGKVCVDWNPEYQ